MNVIQDVVKRFMQIGKSLRDKPNIKLRKRKRN